MWKSKFGERATGGDQWGKFEIAGTQEIVSGVHVGKGKMVLGQKWNVSDEKWVMKID